MSADIVPLHSPEVVPAILERDQKDKAPRVTGSAFVNTQELSELPSSDGANNEKVVSVPAATPHLARSQTQTKESWIPKVRDISAALKGEGQPFPWAIKGLIVQRSANVVSGHPHAMKSFNMLAGCIELAHRQTLWRKFEAPEIKRTLYIETEDGEPLLESRIRGLLRGLGIKDASELPNFHYARLGPFDLVKKKEQLIELIKHFKPHFVVLSTLQGLLGGRDWNQQDKMADVNALLVQIGEMLPGGLVVITHSPLNADAKRPAGTVTQLANYTTAIHFSKKRRNGETHIDVTVDSKTGSEETSFALAVELGDSPEGSGSEVRQIKFAPKKRLTKKEVVTNVLEQEGIDVRTSEVVDIANGRLEPGEKVTARYVNKIKKEFQEEEKGTTGVL